MPSKCPQPRKIKKQQHKKSVGITEPGLVNCPKSPPPNPLFECNHPYNRLLAEDTQDALPDLTGLLAGVNATPDTGLLVVINHRGGLGMVGSQTLGQGVGVVIGTLNQRLAGDVVLHVILRWVEDLVVRTAGGRMDETTGDTSHQQGIINLQLNGVLELLLASEKHFIETLGLSDCSGEAVQDEAVGHRELISTGFAGREM